MRFDLIDRIVELVPGERITAVKNLTLSEEYLADHFPSFPVMPGVLMLEAVTQAGAWLVRASEDFAHSIVTLKTVRNVKYGNFVEPGQTLTVTVEILGQDERETKLKGEGRTDAGTAVSGRLVLERYNIADEDPDRAGMDELLKRERRARFDMMYRPAMKS